MKNSPVKPMAWRLVTLAITPGLWLALQRRPYEPVDVPILFVGVAATVAGAATLLWLSWRSERGVALWCLPLLGALSWEYFEFVNQTFEAGRVHALNPLWFELAMSMVFIGGIIWGVGLFPFWVYKCLRLPVPLLGWGLAGLLALLLAILNLSLGSLNEGTTFFTYFLWAAFMALIALGSMLAQRHGLAAGLFVAACEPLWVDLSVTPRLDTLYSLVLPPTYQLRIFELLINPMVLEYASILVFLVMIPIGLLRSETRKAQLVWLLVPSLITLAVINVAPGFAVGTNVWPYSVFQWCQAALGIVVLWLPLPFAAMLFRAVERSRSRQAEEPAP
ncbi:MAG: hypothetical protein M1482_04060 [Chloroflexi bacterium]|nr:hypothetical protein [Chloroflexota bacterium]